MLHRSIHDHVARKLYCQSEGILEPINESPWGRCLQGAVDARWVVVVVCCCCCCSLLLLVVQARDQDATPRHIRLNNSGLFDTCETRSIPPTKHACKDYRYTRGRHAPAVNLQVPSLTPVPGGPGTRASMPTKNSGYARPCAR